MVRKTFTIMGRDEASSDHDLSSSTTPMQAADIFEMDIDVALGGMDQRKAHMFMRDVASKYGWQKATLPPHPIISSLKRRAHEWNPSTTKCQNPTRTAHFLIHDTPEQIRKKMRKAYIFPTTRNPPVYEPAEHIVFAEFGAIEVTPNPKFGEPSTWTSLGCVSGTP